MKFFTLVFITAFVSVNVRANTWLVGASQLYTVPSQVSTLVQDGDTVEIDAGVYTMDVAKWTANNLVLKGVNGMAQLPSNGLTYGGKAIWVISGNNTTVENINFSEAACVDLNGAGIRQEGSNLIVRHCIFHDNENGILAGNADYSHILIEYSEFANNGAGDGYSHNLYINHIDTLTFRYNYSHGALVGHELKSRANVNFILYNRISDEATGTASRNIDLPNGGTTYIIGNVIEQGPLTENSNIIGYGLEGFTNASFHQLYVANNTIVNNRIGGSFFHLGANAELFKAYNNIIAGSGDFIYGSAPSNMDTSSNRLLSNIDLYNFTDAANYNFSLTDSSFLVLNNAVNAGAANGISLTPTLQYIHTNDAAARCTAGVLDIGAYELCDVGTFVHTVNTKSMFYPNPTSDMVRFSKVQDWVTVMNVLGEVVCEACNVSTVHLNGLMDGPYIISSSSCNPSLLVIQKP